MSRGARRDARIRRATAHDVAPIASLLYRSFCEHEASYTADAFAATVAGPEPIRERMREGPVWIATQGGVVVGTVSAVPEGEALQIRSLAVAPAARGCGIGRRLVECAEEFAVRNGFSRVSLGTTPFLAPAVRLYERLGFSRCDAGPHDLHGTALFTMVKTLPRGGSAAQTSLTRRQRRRVDP